MSTLYLLGGAARSGKTTIAFNFLKKTAVPVYASDILREGARRIFSDESYISVEKLSVSGDLSFHRPGEPADQKHDIHFSKELTDDDLAWNVVEGIINKFDRKDISVMIEGVHITPERVQQLQLKNLSIKAAFVGFIDDLYLEVMLEQAKKNNDWINKAIQEDNGDETRIRQWYQTEVEKNRKLQRETEAAGYVFFPLSVSDFETYCQEVTNYFLK